MVISRFEIKNILLFHFRLKPQRHILDILQGVSSLGV